MSWCCTSCGWGTSYCMVEDGAAECQLLVFKMLLTFIFMVQLSRLLLGHNKDSTDGSNIRYISRWLRGCGRAHSAGEATDWQGL